MKFLCLKVTPDGEYDRTKARVVTKSSGQKAHLYVFISSSTVNLPAIVLQFNIL